MRNLDYRRDVTEIALPQNDAGDPLPYISRKAAMRLMHRSPKRKAT